MRQIFFLRPEMGFLVFILVFCFRTPCAFIMGRTSKIRWFDPSQVASSKSFDFSSKYGWEQYYQDDPESRHMEWHSTISPETISEYCEGVSNLLMIGCGTSHLPDSLATAKLALLDSSQTCVNILSERYRDDYKVVCVCGDALRLSQLFPKEEFDAVVDKGLMDAILCDEGWDGVLQTLLDGVYEVLSPNGIYVLISYKLAESTKEFLVQSSSFGWSFDCKGSNKRVSISIARKH